METKDQKITVETLLAAVSVIKAHIDARVQAVANGIDQAVANKVSEATKDFIKDAPAEGGPFVREAKQWKELDIPKDEVADHDKVLEEVNRILNGSTEE